MLMCSVAIKYACFEHSIFFKVKLSKLKKNVTSVKRNIEFRNNQYGLGSEDPEYRQISRVIKAQVIQEIPKKAPADTREYKQERNERQGQARVNRPRPHSKVGKRNLDPSKLTHKNQSHRTFPNTSPVLVETRTNE